MTADERRLLELLVASDEGATDDLLQAHRSAGLATATPEHALAGGKPVDVTLVRITDAGRRALAEP
jgi:hypothetical protein